MLRKPRLLYNAAQVRELDRIAIEDYRIEGYELMCRAGASAFDLMRARWPAVRRIAVLCGSGNNGGDGYVLARLAVQAGLSAEALALSPAKSASAVQASQDYEAAGGRIRPYDDSLLDQAELLVDGVLGTGLTENLTGKFAHTVASINDTGRPVLALDIPTGVNADTGSRMGAAVAAEATITFIGSKIGLFTGAGPSCTGVVSLDDLDVPDGVFGGVSPLAHIISPEVDSINLPRRDASTHKGLAGRVLVVGGGKGMSGAVRMAAEAAYRCGAGLVQVATHSDHAQQIGAGLPEIMAFGVDDSHQLMPALAAADIVAVGPGLGTGDWARELLERVLETEKPLVVDADALNLLARYGTRRDNWVLTPHPGEAGRLCGSDARTVQADRVAAVKSVRQRFGGIVVLKGPGTLVNDGHIWLCRRGNPGMASGGMGDVLTGMISGLAAQGQTLSAAARYGVWVHAAAADRAAAAAGEIGLLATDLLPYARTIINE